MSQEKRVFNEMINLIAETEQLIEHGVSEFTKQLIIEKLVDALIVGGFNMYAYKTALNSAGVE
ncbi:hypothetical protein [Paraburkholderia graminis]